MWRTYLSKAVRIFVDIIRDEIEDADESDLIDTLISLNENKIARAQKRYDSRSERGYKTGTRKERRLYRRAKRMLRNRIRASKALAAYGGRKRG